MRPSGLIVLSVLAATNAVAGPRDGNWYEKSFYLLHEDHHTQAQFEVGRDADPKQTAELVALSRPDVVQIHAKGNPGWTTYPTKVGHAPPKLARDVLAVWRDLARDADCPFSVYYNIGRDGEIMKRRPAWNRVRADGKPVDRALCYHSGVAEGYLWPMVREIMTGYRPAGFWFDGSCFTVHVCYCEKCRQRFKREHGLDPPKTPDEPSWQAYQEMHRQIYREFVHETAKMIHQIDPKCLVAVNWAYSLRMPEKPDPEIDYLTGDIGNRVEGLSAEAHWYDAQDLPFDLMTQVCTMHEDATGGRPIRRMAPKPRVQIEQEMAVIIANGGRYFAWDNPTPESGLVPERLEYLGRVVAPFLRARQAWCLASKRAPDVSLLNNAAAHYAVAEQSKVCFSKRNNRIEGAADALVRLHLNYEMVPDWRLRARDVRSPLLIVAHPKVLTRQTVTDLIEYAKAGGDLLMTGMGATRDKRLPTLLGLTDIVGPRGPEPLVSKVADVPLKLNHWLFRSRCATAERIIEVKDAQGRTYPLLTRCRLGKGSAWYVAIPLFAHRGKQAAPDALLRSVFDQVVPLSKRLVTTNVADSVEVVLRRKGNAYVLHLVNLAPGLREVIKTRRRRFTKITHLPPVPPCHVSIRLPAKPTAVHLQPSAKALEGWRFESGRLEADLPAFDVHQMVVMQIAKGDRQGT